MIPQESSNVLLNHRYFQKRQKDISSIDDKIIAMYAKGMTTRQISETIEDIYGFEVSEGMVSDITDKLLPKIEEWQNRPLSPVYPIVFIDAVHFSVRDDGVIRKLAAYVVLGINEDGMKEVLSIVVGENESSKYWLSVLNSLKNRGVQDILILCSDGLTGIKDAISTAFPKTEQQRCIVHMVRNTLKYVANKDMKSFAKDLKTIYTAASEEAARKQLETVTKKWSGQYPSAMNRWHDNWDAISPIFKFSKDVRTAFYTTNAIESLNSCLYASISYKTSVFIGFSRPYFLFLSPTTPFLHHFTLNYTFSRTFPFPRTACPLLRGNTSPLSFVMCHVPKVSAMFWGSCHIRLLL